MAFGKLFIRFLLLEAIQISILRWKYITNFWNVVDIGSLLLNATYVSLKLSNHISKDAQAVLGSFVLAVLWVKMFYWMRLFKPFASFIRVVEAIM